MENSINYLHNRVIDYADFNKIIPNRNKFLDPTLFKKISGKILNKSDLLFMPCGLWDDRSMQDEKYDLAKYKIVLFGVLEDGRKMNVVIDEIYPYFEIKIPEKKINGEEDLIYKEYKKASSDLDFANSIMDELNDVSYERFLKILNKEKEQSDRSNYFDITVDRFAINSGKPFKYFQEHNSKYIRFYFNKTGHRKDAIAYLRARGFETAHDDTSCYYRVVCRDYKLSFSSWIVLKNFTMQHSNSNKYLKDEVIKVNIKDIEVFSEEKEKEKNPDYKLPTHLLKDNTMTMCWDIETYNSLQDGNVPLPENPHHNVFMIGITFQWHHANDQILRVCLVDYPTNPNPDFITVVCHTEENLIKAFADCYNKLKPELVMGFNDSSYDWPWIVERSKKYKGLYKYLVHKFDATIHPPNEDESKLQYNYKAFAVKIEATTNANGFNLQVPGYIPLDVMIVFRQLYPTSEKWNLNFFLSKNKLGGKEDMPYQEMFRIYREMDAVVKAGRNIDGEPEYEKLKEEMTLVGKYCVVDSQRCHELMKIRSVLQDKREVSLLSYTSIFDALYRANGMKVRNLVIANGAKKNLKFSNIQSEYVEEGKYPGAYVFPPIKGLLVSKLNIDERVAKGKLGYVEYREWAELPPEEIAGYKEFINAESCFYDDIDDVEEKTKDMSRCMIDFLREDTGRPITGLDFSSLYPSLIMTYNLSPEYMITDLNYAKKIHNLKNKKGEKIHELHKIKFPYNGRDIRGWSVRHDNKLDPEKPDYKFGLFPQILKELFDTRKQMKKGRRGLEYWEHKMEKMRLLPKEEFNKKENLEEFEEAEFQFNLVNSKQKALKVFMNTFYGEAGNKRSPLFMLQIAGGITSAGQKNVKAAHQFVEDRACKVYYGDSVPHDTPIIIRYSEGYFNNFNEKDNIDINTIDIRTIDNIPSDNNWEAYPQFKAEEVEPVRIDKQQNIPVKGLEVWTTRGWSKIKRIIRHRTNKQMYRINTYLGCVDVTEDHALLNVLKESVKPEKVRVGYELYHSFPYCSNAHQEKMKKRYFEIAKKTPKNKLCEKITSDKILRNEFNYDLTDEETREIEYLKKYNIRENGIPSQFLNRRYRLRYEIVDVFFKTGLFGFFKNIVEFSSKLFAQQLIFLLYSIGRTPLVSYNNLTKKYTVTFDEKTDKKLDDNDIINRDRKIKYVEKLEHITDNLFVYDLETEDGTFLNGVGSIITLNTDSIYLTMPEKEFKKIDIDYFTEKISKLEYWKEMVRITFNVIKPLNQEVNNMFIEDNGTNFLKMAYEEVLFPVIFTAKKKYAGVPHISEPNFSKDVPLFIRGLELKKRGVSDLLKNVCNDILRKCVSYENILTVLEIVNDKIDEIYNTDWGASDSFSNFIMTGVYKPDKQNVKMHTFRERMIRERSMEIKPGERIKYVIVKKYPFKYDLRGRKVPLQVGDTMELAELAQAENLPIDLDYYMSKSINGQLARLITYYSGFNVEPADPNDADDIKKAEDDILKHAKKYVEDYCSKYYAKYQNKGVIYKKIYKTTSDIVQKQFLKKLGGENGDNSNEKELIKILNSSVDLEELESWISEKTKSRVEKKKLNKTYGEIYINAVLSKIENTKLKQKTIAKLQKIYYSTAFVKTNILKESEKLFKERESILLMRLKKSLSKIRNAYNLNTRIIENLSNYLKDVLNIDNSFIKENDDDIPDFEELQKSCGVDIKEIELKLEELAENELSILTDNLNDASPHDNTRYDEARDEDDDEFDDSDDSENNDVCKKDVGTVAIKSDEKIKNPFIEGLEELKYIYINLVSNYDYIYKTRSIVEYLKSLRDKKIGATTRPDNKTLKNMIEKMVAESTKEMLDEIKH